MSTYTSRPRQTGKTALVAWLVGVDVDEVRAYMEIGDLPSHWAATAQATMRRLGVTCLAEAEAAYLRARMEVAA